MSPPSPSPYKSRLFNFLNRQSLNLSDRLIMAARHLKVAAEWGVQILLYPVYLLLQTGRMAGQKLQQTVASAQLPAASPQSEPQQQPATADRPLAQVLKVVEEIYLSAAVADKGKVEAAGVEQVNLSQTVADAEKSSGLQVQPSSELTQLTQTENQQQLMIQGVASLLPTRELVLVTADNQILSLLSAQQQQQLQQRIRWEVANYCYERRLGKTATRPFPSLLPAFKQKSATILPPVRYFWQLMGWVQGSRVAIALNLFGEANLPPSLTTTSSTTFPSPSEIVLTLDSKLAELEIEPLVHQVGDRLEELRQQLQQRFHEWTNSPVAAQPQLRQLQSLIQAALNYFFGHSSGTAFSYSNHKQLPAEGHISANSPPPLTENETNTNPFQIQVLLPAAIDYFWGQRQQQLYSMASEEDPWLSWDDLFGEASAGQQQDDSSNSPVPSQLPRVSGAKPAKFLPTKKPTSWPGRQPNRVAPSKLAKTKKPWEKVVPLTESETEDFTLDTSPDWVETQATPVGYVKHPLETILAWLDRAVLWLEELLARIWRWLQRLI